MKNKFKSVIAMMLSLLVILSAFPMTALASTYITDINSDAEFGVIKDSYENCGHEMHYANYSGQEYIVFCCQFGVKSPNGSTYKYGDDFKRYVNDYGDVYDKIAKYIAFGYTLKYGDGIPDTKEKWIAACCTQQYVWETLGVNPSRTSWNSEYMNDKLFKDWLSDTEELISLYYNKKPSFNKSAKAVNIGSTTTLTDANGVFKFYPSFEKTVNGVTFKHSKGNNELVISVSKDCSVHSVSFNSAAHKIYADLPMGIEYNASTMNYVYFDFAKGNIQDVMFSKFVDPQTFVVDVNIDYGALKIVKTSEDGKVSGIEFEVKGDNLNQTVTTNENGEILLDKLTPGKYTVTEKTDDKYVKPGSQTVTVSNDETAAVSFSNVLKKFNVTVTKTDIETDTAQGDASLSGAVYGIYKNGELVDKYTTDENGKFTTKYYVCDDDWTIQEIAPSEGYLIDDFVYHIGAEAKNYEIEFNNAAANVKEQVIKGKVAIIKHTDDGSTQIETPEKGAEFQIYLKSAGSFANARTNERDTLVCDEDGFASSKMLPYGIYTVHQTKGWDGREKIKDFDVLINENGKTYKFLINNADFYSYLKVEKVDAETGKSIAFAGAGFEIYDGNGHRISMQYTYPEVTTIQTFYTNSEGYLITPEKLSSGEYTLIEVQAPYGYVIDSTPIPFTVTEDKASTDTGVTVIEVKARNTAQKGVIEISKTGEVFSSVGQSDNIYTPVFKEESLKNAVFEIYAGEDIITLDGTIRAEKGQLVDTVTTDENGIAKSKELYLGKYIVKEKTAPNGMTLDKTKHLAELSYSGQDIKLTSTVLSLFNERQKVQISLSKVLEKNDKLNIGANGEILSVRFGIFSNEEITAADGISIPKDALIAASNCDENGNIIFDCDLPLNFKYYVKEIATDEHYILDETKYEFSTDYAGQDTEAISIEINDGKPIENKLKPVEEKIIVDIPETGKDRETAIAIGVLLLSVLFGILCCLRRFKNRNDDTND